MSGSQGKDENRDKKISLDVAQFVTVLNVKKKHKQTDIPKQNFFLILTQLKICRGLGPNHGV